MPGVGRTILAIGLCATLFSAGEASAESKPWRANNNSDVTVKVVYTALGCAGMAPKCYAQSFDRVCKTKILQPGESWKYRFPDGTSRRKKVVCNMDYDKEMDWTATEDVAGDRKKNGIKLHDDGRVRWYDE